MLTAVIVIFLLAAAAPLVHRLVPAASHWLLALVPAAITLWFATHLPEVGAGGVVAQAVPWVPSLGVDLAFRLDGLSLLFALLITGIGTFIVLYSGAYLHGHEHQGRFYLFIIAFMGAMLGLVLADDVVSLFVFWELTSITSFLLIGFNHADPSSRRSAVQALLVTASGGLALLAGLILLGMAGGSFRLSGVEASGVDLTAHALYLPMLVLILLGCFTKSAQVPFHFWLPNAMDAPTPVSAYLHSATMVKAGIYLMARLNPTLGGTEVWMVTLAAFGTVTALWGGLMALRSTDLKKILAYTTLMALGTLTMLVGLGTEYAIKAFATFLLAHSLYKGALFMGAGSVDHGSGTRDVRALSGLWSKMPVTGAFILLAALSMAGLPPLFGFVAKELMYEGLLGAGAMAPWLLAGMVVANATMLAAAGLVFAKPFLGSPSAAAAHAHEGGPGLLAGLVVLALLGALFGLWGALPGEGLLTSVVGAVAGRPLEVDLYLWHGLTPALGLSALTIALGAAMYLGRGPLVRGLDTVARLSRVDFDAGWDRLLAGMDGLARIATGGLQTGTLRHYLLIMFAFMVAALGGTILVKGALPERLGLVGTHWLGWSLAAFMVVGTVATIMARSRLAAIVAISVVGLSIALFFLVYGAPDVAITQLMVETLTVIIIVLVLARLPMFAAFERPTNWHRLRDGTIAIAMGAVTTALVLAVTNVNQPMELSEWFAAKSYLEAYGRNVVNVILVDFRAFDTLGEVAVVAIAGLGVYALLKATGAAPPGQAPSQPPALEHPEVEARP